MACFLAPLMLSAFTHGFRKKFPKNWHIEWLNVMIWGGALGLAVEHVAHQEIVPWFPFLSAMTSYADTVVMLKEMAIVGGSMTLALIATWAVLVVVYEKFISRTKNSLIIKASKG